MRAAPTSLRVTIDLWRAVHRFVDALPLPPPQAAAKQTSSASAVAKRLTRSAYAPEGLREEVLENAARAARPAETPALVGDEHPAVRARAWHGLAAQVPGRALRALRGARGFDRSRERMRRLE